MNVVICDDEISILKQVETDLLSKYKGLNILAFSSGRKAIDWMKSTGSKTDILITDIEMDEDGISTAHEIEQLNPSCRVIFITAHIQYAESIFAVKPDYMLIKPITQERLFEAMNRSLEALRRVPKEILITSQGIVSRCNESDIVYAESDKRLMHLHMRKKQTTYYIKMIDFEKLVSDRFLRVHQSYLVNMDYIRKLDAEMCYLTNGECVPVSRTRYEKAKKSLIVYYREQIKLKTGGGR